MRLPRVRLALLAGLVASIGLLFASNILLAQGAVKQPEMKIKFTEIGKWSTHSIDVAVATLTEETGDDGSVIRGAAFRVTASEPFDVENVKIGTMIHIVMTKCGTDMILVTDTLMFDPQGKLIKQTKPMSTVKNSAPTDSNTFVYKFLCSGTENKKPNAYNPKLV